MFETRVVFSLFRSQLMWYTHADSLLSLLKLFGESTRHIQYTPGCRIDDLPRRYHMILLTSLFWDDNLFVVDGWAPELFCLASSSTAAAG